MVFCSGVAELHHRGYKVAVVSGGFRMKLLTVPVKRIGLDYVEANRLEVKGWRFDRKSTVTDTKMSKASLIEWAAEND